MRDKCYWLFERNGVVTIRWSRWYVLILFVTGLVLGCWIGLTAGLIWGSSL